MGFLRLLFAMSVVIHHTYPLWGYPLMLGDIPVRSFFIISGFYMALILCEKYPPGKYWLFITNRFLRIYPLYWVVLIATLGASFILIQHFNYTPARFITDATLLVRTDYITFNPDNANPMMIVQAWTLVVEFLFYLIAPFLVRRNWLVLISVGCMSLLIRYVVYHYEVTHGFQPKDTFFLSDLVFFVLGVASYKLYARAKNILKPNWITLSVPFVVIVLFTLGYTYLPDFTWRWLSLKQVMYYCALTACLPSVFLLCKRSCIDRFIGELSYPIYIWHALITVLVIYFFHPKQDTTFYTVLVLFFTLFISWVSVRYFILPLDRYREKRVVKEK